MRWILCEILNFYIKSKLERSLIFEVDFYFKRGGIFVKIRCVFKIIILKEFSIFSILNILGVNFFLLFLV